VSVAGLLALGSFVWSTSYLLCCTMCYCSCEFELFCYFCYTLCICELPAGVCVYAVHRVAYS